MRVAEGKHRKKTEVKIYIRLPAWQAQGPEFKFHYSIRERERERERKLL
jgi:hypothetical protein